MTTKTKGFLCAILAAVIFGSMPLGAKIFYAGGGNSASLVFFRNFLPLPVLYYFAKKDSSQYALSKTDFLKILFLVIGGLALTPILLFESYQYIPSGMATTIHFIYPVFVLLGSYFFNHEPISPQQLLCVVLCTIGICFFGSMEGSGAMIGIVLSFLSGVTYAFYTIYLNKSGLRNIPKSILMFYSIFLSAMLSFLYAFFRGGLTYQFPFEIWIVVIAFAMLVTLGGVQLYQMAVKEIGGTKTAIMNTFEPITSIVWGLIFFQEQLTLFTIIGISLILVAVVMLTLFEQSDKKDK